MSTKISKQYFRRLAFLKQSLHDFKMFNQVSSWSLHTSPCKAHSHLVVGGPVLQYLLKAKT